MKENIIEDIELNINKDSNNLLECEEYFLMKENNIYKLIIEKRNNNIIIKCRNYNIKYNNNDLSLLTNTNYNNINEAYDYIINIFEKNNVSIKDITLNKSMILQLKINILNEEKEIEITLEYNKEAINNNHNELIKEVNDLKDEIKIIRKEMNDLKSNSFCIIDTNSLQNNTPKKTNLKNIKFLKDIAKDSFAFSTLDNTFTIFKSIDNILNLIYANESKSIISYNLINNKKIKELKHAHENFITNFRHYLDNINKRDLILSISDKDNNLKLWNNQNWECLLNYKEINNSGNLYSACFLNDNNQIYILTSNYNNENSEPIKIYDFNGNKIKEINNSNEKTFFIDCYNDSALSKNYIITGNIGCVKSYDYNKNEVYHKYPDNGNKIHFSVVVNCHDEKNINLIESSYDGDIRIWNFHSGELINIFKINDEGLYGICLWDSNYLFVGGRDKAIRLIDIENKKIVITLRGHNRNVLTLKKISHPKYGECLLSQSNNDYIKIWNFKA